MITTPSVAEILVEEFMKPNKITAEKLEKDTGIPVQSILNGKRKITVSTSLKLGQYFGVSGWYFLNIQDDIDIRNKCLYNA